MVMQNVLNIKSEMKPPPRTNFHDRLHSTTLAIKIIIQKRYYSIRKASKP